MKKKNYVRIVFSSGFVTLFVLQSLVFVAGFSGLLVYQVHRLLGANHCRLQALSEKAILKAAVPHILECMQRQDLYDIAVPMQVKISCKYFLKQLLVEPISDDGTALIFKLTALREHEQRGCWVYFFVERRDKKSDIFVYRGMQFGTAL